ncbi:MAG: hypothetical protein ACKVPX_02490 [Myxococcaceae bacterium]
MLHVLLAAILFAEPPGPPAEMPPPGRCVKDSGRRYHLDGDARATLEAKGESAVSAWMRVVPNFQKGRVQGMKLFDIAPGSFGDSCGLRTNDIVLKLNGVALNSVEDMIDAPSVVRAKGRADLLVQRAGRRIKMTIMPR